MIKAKQRGYLFSEVNIDTPSRSAFPLDFENKLSCNPGYLIPTLVEEVLPGDTFELKTSTFARFAPMLSPLMHKVDIMQYTFFVPNRLIWDEWENFISPGNGRSTMLEVADKDYTPPAFPIILPYGTTVTNPHTTPGSLMDYLGAQFPVNYISQVGYKYQFGVSGSGQYRGISALPFRAYQFIYNEYFRDQNLTKPVEFSKGSGIQSDQEALQLMSLRKKCWEKDIFTSALPLPQRGPEVYLPIGDDAPVVLDTTATDHPTISNGNGSVAPGSQQDTKLYRNPTNGTIYFMGNSGQMYNQVYDPKGTLKVDLTQATSATINTLRMATRLQSFLEKSARVGGRYVESLLAHFGVTASDARIQRPEYIGGNRIPVQVSAVTATSGSSVTVGGETFDNIQGSQTGIAQASGSDFIRYTAEEHGILMQISVVVPRTAYCQGVRPLFLHENYLDFAWPEFGHLGEEEVDPCTLYGTMKNKTEIGTFGYQSRYANYKYHADECHGDFTTNLDFWTMTRKFSNQPLLNTSFVEVEDEAWLRPFANQNPKDHHVYMDIWHDFKVLRALPLYGTPTL